MKTTPGMWAALVLFVASPFLILVIGNPALIGQEPIPAHDTIYIPPAGYSGLTFCRGGHIEQWVRDPRYSGLMPNPLDAQREWEGILAHERTHVEQYQRYTSCDAAETAWGDNVDSLLSLESEAYCAQAMVFLKDDTFTASELRGRIILRLMARAPGTTPKLALQWLMLQCPALR